MANPLQRISDLSPERRAQLISKLVGQKKAAAPPPSSPAPEPRAELNSGHPHYCVVGTPGKFESIRFVPMQLAPPGPGQLQVRARSYGLNFRDLMIAMGMYPATPGVPSVMGSDFAGEVVACGDGVDEFKPGDEFFGLSVGHLTGEGVLGNCHFPTSLNVMVEQVVPKPGSITFEEAAGVPTVFATAYHGLYQMARVQPGERVLIHSATGGVGMAAIQVARWLGATIYATAGSEEKHAVLRSLGIEHPMDSRSTAFAGQLLELTDGQGIDVILNTLSGEAVAKGLEILRPFGRFIQVDKKDIAVSASLSLGPFKNGLSFTAIDMGLLAREPGRMKGLLTEIAGHLRADHFRPVQHTSFPLAKLGEALNYMSRARHMGKIVLHCH